jgi:DNA-binding MarR family transcriptional regulator
VDSAQVQRVAEFRVALQRFQARGNLAARASGLTPQRYLLLVAIRAAPDGSGRSSVPELADRLEMPQTTVSDLAARAEAVGLIAREQSRVDGRVSYLRLTREGERRLEKCIDSLNGDRAEFERALGVASRRIRSIDRGP